MERSLPETPSVEHLKKQAKELLAAQRRGETSAFEPLRLLPRFRGASDDAIAGAAVTLGETQQALARSYGYKNWAFLKRLVEQGLVPPKNVDASYFQDYRWGKDRRSPVGRPIGVPPVDPAQTGNGFFKFIRLGNGDRVEQYDRQGRFVQIIYDPADADRGTRKLQYQRDGRTAAAVRVDENGVVRTRETYSFLSSPEEPLPLVKAEVYNADGRLLEIHTPQRVGPTAEDIHVTDVLGKLKVILHHDQLDKGEPVRIQEEWSSGVEG